MTRQSRFVFRVAWVVLRNAHDSEDVVQEAFLKLYRTGAWRRMDDERAFLARTAWRLAVDRSRANRASVVAMERGPVCGADPERAAIAADSSAVVRRLIDALPEELRQPLALSAIEELRSGDIAVLMGISEGTVRSRIMRARQILRQKLMAMKEGVRRTAGSEPRFEDAFARAVAARVVVGIFAVRIWLRPVERLAITPLSARIDVPPMIFSMANRGRVVHRKAYTTAGERALLRFVESHPEQALEVFAKVDNPTTVDPIDIPPLLIEPSETQEEKQK